MKKGILFIITFLFLLQQNFFGAPNLKSLPGLLNLISAQGESKKHFHINLHLWGTQESLISKYWVETKEKEVKDYYAMMNLYFGMYYSFTDYFALSLNTTFLGDYIATRNSKDRPLKPYIKENKIYFGKDDVASFDVGDTYLFFEITYPASKGKKLFIGFIPFFSFPTGVKKGELNTFNTPNIQKGGIFREYTTEKMNWGFIAPVTLVLKDIKFHTNLGFLKQTKKTLKDQLLIGAGLELIAGNFIPFIEYTTEKWLNGEEQIEKNPAKITAGFRIVHNNGTNFDLATEIPLVEHTDSINSWSKLPSWAVYCSLLSYCFKPPFGTLIIKTIDNNSLEPVEAVVSFPKSENLKEVKTSPDTGIVTLENIPKGIIEVVVTKEGYLKKAEAIPIKKGEETIKEFKLMRDIPNVGTLTGRIIDSKTRESIEAIISFPNTALKQINSNPQTGTYVIENIPTGIIIVEVSKAGFLKQTATLVIKKQETTIKDFELTPEEKNTGSLSGSIIDSKTQTPIRQAIISLPGTNLPDILSDANNGTYVIENIPAGNVLIEVTKSNYIKQAVNVVIEKGKISIKDFVLKPIGTAILTGKVVDKKTGEPLPATISFPGTEIENVICDAETGIYKINISSSGSYVVMVKLDGYISQSFPIIIEENKATIRDFSLVKKGTTITLKGIYFDTNKATIKPESYKALSLAAKFLEENPKMKIEIQGHTDDVGSAEYNQKLSEARALAVKRYLVERFNILASRLLTKGYGEFSPIASNLTPQGRAENRRIDFLILGEE